MIWHGTLYVVLSLAEMDNYSSIITNCISKHPLKCLYLYLCKCMMYTYVNVCTGICYCWFNYVHLCDQYVNQRCVLKNTLISLPSYHDNQ